MKRVTYIGFLFLCLLMLVGCSAKTENSEAQEMQEQQQTQTSEAFQLVLDGVSYSQDAAEIRASSISVEALGQLPQMKALALVTATDGGDGENLEQLQTYCNDNGIAFQIALGDRILTGEETDLAVYNVTEAQVKLLSLMPDLETLHLPEPQAPAEALLELKAKLPHTAVTWEKTVLGMTFPGDAAEIDLTPVLALAEGQALGDKTAYDYGLEFQTMGQQEDPPKTAKVVQPFPDKAADTSELMAEAEAAMAYFPEADRLLMCGAWLDNEAMAQFREAHREDYKVVWTVRCGDIAPRTDATFFMPTKYFVQIGGFTDLDSYNLMYCEDMECIDLGHMTITDLEFVRYMPKLKYLVITLTFVGDLSPLSACKELVFLEMDWCDRVTDYSPLLECTALEDLNIGETFGDIKPVLEMTWLKNLWLVGCEESSYHQAKAAMPDTNIGYYYWNPDDVWRELPNYYAMRDALLMFYME